MICKSKPNQEYPACERFVPMKEVRANFLFMTGQVERLQELRKKLQEFGFDIWRDFHSSRLYIK